MKGIVMLVACAFACFVQAVVAQESKNVKEPEFIGVFFSLGESGDLLTLERQTPVQKVKVKGLGFGGGEGYMEIKGDRSSIRFKADQKIMFVVRVASQLTDPVSIVQFFRFEPVKGARRLMMAKVGSMGISSKNVTNQGAVAFNAAKYGESSFKVAPANPLSPGEYCLSGPGTQDGFCFGVDEAVVRN